MSAVFKRVQRELDLWYGTEEMLGFVALPKADDMLEWDISMPGPDGSPYEGGTVYLHAKLPTDYPFKPPRITFARGISHCNIHSRDGAVSLDIIQESWSPGLTMLKVTLSLQYLLANPNFDDAIHSHLALLGRNDRARHDAHVREAMLKLYKKPPPTAFQGAEPERLRAVAREVLQVDVEASAADDELLITLSNILTGEQRLQLQVPRKFSAADFRGRLKECLDLPPWLESKLVWQDGTLLPVRGLPSRERAYLTRYLATI